MKIGVWAKTQIEFETVIGKSIAEEFVDYEKYRELRRQNQRQPLKLEKEKYPILERVDYLKYQQREQQNKKTDGT